MMIKRNILIGLWVFLLGVGVTAYAADTEVVLDSNDSSSSFTVKNLSLNDIIRIGGDGKVGIGITPPTVGSTTLHIKEDKFTGIILENDVSERIAFQHHNTLGPVIHALDGSFRIVSRGLIYGFDQLIVKNGDVGIGTSNPAHKLDVSGDINFTGSLLRNGSPFGGGGAGDGHSLDAADGSPTDAVFVDNDGNVGIGTQNPVAKLEVYGKVGIGITPPTVGSTTLHIKEDKFTGIILENDVSERIAFQHHNTLGPVIHALDGSFRIVSRGLTYGFDQLIVKNGDVGIGTASPSYKLHVNGTAAGTSWTNLSSCEYKENIKKVDDSKYTEMLYQLMKLEPTTYNYKKEIGDDHTTKIGFIAEEMPKEVLSKDGKGVDVYELLTYTIGAMKEQQKIISELSAKIKDLEDRI